jgi:hypothetical protein
VIAVQLGQFLALLQPSGFCNYFWAVIDAFELHREIEVPEESFVAFCRRDPKDLAQL